MFDLASGTASSDILATVHDGDITITTDVTSIPRELHRLHTAPAGQPVVNLSNALRLTSAMKFDYPDPGDRCRQLRI